MYQGPNTGCKDSKTSEKLKEVERGLHPIGIILDRESTRSALTLADKETLVKISAEARLLCYMKMHKWMKTIMCTIINRIAIPPLGPFKWIKRHRWVKSSRIVAAFLLLPPIIKAANRFMISNLVKLLTRELMSVNQECQDIPQAPIQALRQSSGKDYRKRSNRRLKNCISLKVPIDLCVEAIQRTTERQIEDINLLEDSRKPNNLFLVKHK